MLRDAALHIFCYAFMTTIRTLSRSVGDMEAVWAAPQPLAALGAALLSKLVCASKDVATVFQLDKIVGIRIDRIVGIRIVGAFQSRRSADGNGLDTEKKKSFFFLGETKDQLQNLLKQEYCDSRTSILENQQPRTSTAFTGRANDGIHQQREQGKAPRELQTIKQILSKYIGAHTQV